MRNRPSPTRNLPLVPLLLAGLIVGCGGGGGHHHSSAKGGSVRLTVQWPSQKSAARAAVDSAQSLLVKVLDGSTVLVMKSLPKLAATATIGGLSAGAKTVEIFAYDGTGGTGALLAKARVASTVVASQTTDVRLNLTGVVDHLEVSPKVLSLDTNRQNNMVITAFDADQNVVLIGPNALSFTSDDSPMANVDALGLVTAGLGTGTTTITIMEAESGKWVKMGVAVTSPVTVSPHNFTLAPLGTQTLTAALSGSLGNAVTWSVYEGNAGGSITSGGVYTAPSTPGLYHVIATSIVDPSRTDAAFITVAAGGGGTGGGTGGTTSGGTGGSGSTGGNGSTGGSGGTGGTTSGGSGGVAVGVH